MRTISYRLGDLRKAVLEIGYVAENEHTRVQIDAGEVYAEYPHASVALTVQPPKGTPYPAVISRDGNTVIWDIKDSDLVYRGAGEIQLTWSEGDVVVKSCISRININRSLVGNGTAPDPLDDFLAEAGEALTAIPETIDAAFDAITAEAETLPAGSSATASFNGETKTLTIGVPKGDKGDNGDPGPAGADGKDGAPGKDGADGAPGKDGKDGADGADGHTPVKGTDYWTAEDKAEIVADAAAEVAGDIIDDTAGEGDTGKTWSADKLAEMDSGLTETKSALSELEEHETYSATGSYEYDPVTPNTAVNGVRSYINGYNYASISQPTTTNMTIYPVEKGKTYKVSGYCNNTNVRPLLIVADSVVTSGTIANPGTFDYALGTNETTQVEEQEYTALRNGYLYINYKDNTCGVWLKRAVPVKKYHMDDILDNIADIDSIIDKITDTRIDSESAWTKVVPKNAEPVAKITSLANSVTLVRSILSRNVADKNAVGDVEIKADHTMKKGIKTVLLPAGRYYVILGNVGNYTMVKKYENGLYSDTMYKEQFPMKVSITDPGGGCFIVYASTVEYLGDLSGLFIGKLHDGEYTIPYESYSEKTYTPEAITLDNRIEVVPNGFIEFVNSSNSAVASTVEYTVYGKDDDTTTRKDFVVSPDGSKFLPMVKNDGSVVAARVVPKKAFFIGNSLTSGWQTFGEAASESDKDFVARFSDVVSDLDSNYTFSRKWSTNFEQQTSLANAQSWVTTNIDPLLSSDLDLIVVQLSENVVGNASAEAVFPETSLWLLEHLRTECPKARVVWMGVWFDRGWVKTLLANTAKTGCEYVDIRPLYKPENIAAPGDVYKMEADYTKEYTVDSFTVDNGAITITFTLDGKEYTSTIPSYSSYTSSSDTSITVTGIYHVINTYYAYIHPGDEGFRKIANKLLFDLGISDSEETIPAE